MKKVHHIGVAVAELDSAIKAYEALGLQLERVEVVPSEGVKVAFLPVGETLIELLEPTEPTSPLAQFLAKRGPGLHHICLAVNDLEQTIKQAQGQGLRLIGEAPRLGAGGARVCFVHPQSLFGVLVELWEEDHA